MEKKNLKEIQNKKAKNTSEKKVGFTIGKFAPFHKGHEYLITKGMEQTDEFIVILYETDVICIPIKKRACWIKHIFPKVKILYAYNPPSEYGLDEKSVSIQINYLKQILKDTYVTHFYSSEEYGEYVAKYLNVKDVRIDNKREFNKISGRWIREDLEKWKDFLEEIVYRDCEEFLMEENINVRKRLINLAEPEYRKFHLRLCTTKYEILGVRLPILRGIAREIAKTDFRKFLKHAKDKYYEEVMLQGMVIGTAKMDISERLEYVEKFVPKIDNWAICDSFSSGLKACKKNLGIVWNFIQQYRDSKEEFELRFFIIIMMGYYLTDEYIDQVINIIDGLKHEAYYVKMAASWLVSVAYVKYPEKILNYLNNNHLDNFTYNKSLQKIIESNRVSKEEKDKMRSMKRKI